MGLLKEPYEVPVNSVAVARPIIRASRLHPTERANTKIIPNLPHTFSDSFNRQIGTESAGLQSRVSSPEMNWHIVWIPSDITKHRDSDQHSSGTLLHNVHNRRHYAYTGFPLDASVTVNSEDKQAGLRPLPCGCPYSSITHKVRIAQTHGDTDSMQ